MQQLNIYGDTKVETKAGFGVDIASQRADDLDNMALETIRNLVSIEKVPDTLDIGCGNGGQAIRMSQAGAMVTALDIEDYRSSLLAAAATATVQDRVLFVRSDMKNLSKAITNKFDVIVCQRAIHYLPYLHALAAVRSMKGLLKPQGKIFISASGLLSELGTNYPHHNHPLPSRFAQLSEAMQQKHAIMGSVCLYTEEDMKMLLEEAGLRVEVIFSSAFGNIKAVAL